MTVLEQLNEDLQDDLNRIARRIKPGAKITLVVRNPTVEGDAGVVSSNDDLGEAIREIRRRQADERKAGGIPTFYPCGCSHLKVAAGRCSHYKPGEVP